MSAEHVPVLSLAPKRPDYVDKVIYDLKDCYKSAVKAIAGAPTVTAELLDALADAAPPMSRGRYEFALILHAVAVDPANPYSCMQQCATSEYADALIAAGLVVARVWESQEPSKLRGVQYAPCTWFTLSDRLTPGSTAAIKKWAMERNAVARALRTVKTVAEQMKLQAANVRKSKTDAAAKERERQESLAENAAKVAAFKENEAGKAAALPTPAAKVAPVAPCPQPAVRAPEPTPIPAPAPTAPSTSMSNIDVLAAADLLLVELVKNASTLSRGLGYPDLALPELSPPSPETAPILAFRHQLQHHLDRIKFISQQLAALAAEG